MSTYLSGHDAPKTFNATQDEMTGRLPTTRHLAQMGHQLVIGARRTDRLTALQDELRAQGAGVDALTLDVTRLDDVQRIAAFAQQRYGRIDVLINNAGIMPLSPLAALKVDEWNRMIDVNVRGVLHGIAAVLPVMQPQGRGHIINVASIGAHCGHTDCRRLLRQQIRRSRDLRWAAPGDGYVARDGGQSRRRGV
ncbi:NAD(P)-dependent dehydrogenase (short-subunit alcohol dehydrogenase family) [Paraburkholderia atlantica]